MSDGDVPGYGPATFGDRWAEAYDAWTELRLPGEAEPTVEFLASVAGDGPVLELAIGTGRIALPLRERGLDVRGIDASEAMVGKLREKPGGEDIPVTIGDFADVGVEGPFGLIFVVFNTFWALLTQEDQVRCMGNVASRLGGDGVFVVEAFVPDPGRFDRGQRIAASYVDADSAAFEISRVDHVHQRVDSQHVVLTPEGPRMYPVQIRWVWPSELDLMARLAGLRLRERWGGWRREPYTGEGRHVSVYELEG